MIRFLTHLVFYILASLVVALPTLALAAEGAPIFSVTYADAEAAVGQALGDKGAGTKVAAILNGHKADALFSYNKPVSVEVRGLTFDKDSARWSANLLAVSDGEVVTAIPATGRFDEVVELPVLKRQVRNGEIIGQSDIEVRDFPINRTRSDSITDISHLIGKSPLRTISPLRPVREHEIAEPAVVKKNSMVKMRYSSSGMEISTNGQALEEGSRGSMISVRNLNSKKTVRAIVEDAQTVNVGPVVIPAEAMNTSAASPAGVDAYAAN